MSSKKSPAPATTTRAAKGSAKPAANPARKAPARKAAPVAEVAASPFDACTTPAEVWAALAALATEAERDAAAPAARARVAALTPPEVAPAEVAPVTAPEVAPVAEVAAPAAPIRWVVRYGDAEETVPANGDPVAVLGNLIAASGAPYVSGQQEIIDLMPPPHVAPDAPAPVAEVAAPVAVPAPVPAVRSTFDAPVVSDEAAARIAASRAAVAAVGLSYGETWFADGTILAASGVDAATKALREVAALPPASTALPALRSRVIGEDRRDVSLSDVAEVRMNADGWIIIPGEANPIRPEVGAFQALAARSGLVLTEPFMRARDLKDPRPVVASLAGTFNAWQQQIGIERAEAGSKAKSAVLGLRTVDGERRVFRVVSDRYAREIGIDQVAQIVGEVLADAGADPNCEVRYDGSRVQIDAIWPTPVDPGAFGVGELWKLQVRVRSADDGSGGLGVSVGLHFARCLNFSQSTTEASIMARRHMGDSAALAVALRAAVAQAHATVQPLVAAWGAAKGDDLAASLPVGHEARGMSVEELFPGFMRSVVATREAVPVGLSARAVPALVKAWSLDDGPGGPSSGLVTRAGVVNALTRYAHTQADPWAQAGIERLASSYLDPRRSIVWTPEKARRAGA